MLEGSLVSCLNFNSATLIFSIMSIQVQCHFFPRAFYPLPVFVCPRLTAVRTIKYGRMNSTYVALPRKGEENDVLNRRLSMGKQANDPILSGLERVPTSAIVRSLFLGLLLSSPTLSRIGFKLLGKMTYSRSTLLNPDANPVLRAIVKPLFYDQFCAGTNRKEVFKTRDSIRRLGYAGVILCYGKEIQMSRSNELQSTGGKYANQALEIEQWKIGNLKTLGMVAEGDWIGLK